MKIKHQIIILFVVAFLSAGCVRYAVHGEKVSKDSAGITITNSLYRVETERLLWFDKKGEVVWLAIKGRPTAQLQFDKVDDIEPLAAEVQRDTAIQVIDSEYSAEPAGAEAIAGIIENCNSIDTFTEGIVNVSIFTKYKSGWGDVPGIIHDYLAPSETPYTFSIKRHKLKEKAVPDWVRKEIEQVQ